MTEVRKPYTPRLRPCNRTGWEPVERSYRVSVQLRQSFDRYPLQASQRAQHMARHCWSTLHVYLPRLSVRPQFREYPGFKVWRISLHQDLICRHTRKCLQSRPGVVPTLRLSGGIGAKRPGPKPNTTFGNALVQSLISSSEPLKQCRYSFVSTGKPSSCRTLMQAVDAETSPGCLPRTCSTKGFWSSDGNFR